MLRSLEIENLDPEEHFEDLVLTLESDPAFVKEKVWPVARIDPRGLIRIRKLDLEVNGGFLLERNEKVGGVLTFRLTKDGIPFARLRVPIELLANNEWGGAGFMPELLAAFCMPNDLAVDAILRDASQVLRQAGKPDRIDGYQSKSRERDSKPVRRGRPLALGRGASLSGS